MMMTNTCTTSTNNQNTCPFHRASSLIGAAGAMTFLSACLVELCSACVKTSWELDMAAELLLFFGVAMLVVAWLFRSFACLPKRELD